MEMSKGEYRVGATFNPSGNPEVNRVKALAAELISRLQLIVNNGDEAARCAAIAQTKFEEAAMWAVKALTKLPRN